MVLKAVTGGKGELKYVGQIALGQLCLLGSSEGLIEPDVDFTSVASSLARHLFVFSLVV